ncbi:MAG: hypothetical protein A3G91_03275 [Omnitrophica WOR_2 bacterium RIFCSPLOWO2_12_FULL_50_9]|nr:MAG: hypothetical protein A3D87_06240 [Omnitrophica WOR_2 bacterium RIFCSPHIGHO2_02_FULL_50_17]OGX40785.1 MAG: hypothetical protein A3G91_03275 [Omnitrophica WOR_2 bacterium RIFCSPLOWO2_12_FULL_50_9]
MRRINGWDRRYKAGQNTIEYLILVAIIIVVSLLFAQQGGVFRRALNATYDTSMNYMLNMAQRILE